MKILNSGPLFMILFGLFALSAGSQEPIKNYEKEWKKVEDFVKQKLPKSALAEVKKIYALAKKDKQDAQVIKSLVSITALQQENREDNELFSIKEIEEEIAASKEPVSSILNSLLASQYWAYYQAHRWEFYNRTQTIGYKKDDISTWGPEDFHKVIGALFIRSIRDEKLLQQTRLQPYDAIIVKGNTRHLRPTLFDLLAHHAIQYFQTDERDINRPAYAFEIDQAAAFDPAADFIHHKFTTKDSLSLQYKALLLYQQLIAFHLRDSKPDALIDLDIQRIAFVKSKSVHPDKEQLYFNAINHIAHQYEDIPAAAQAWYLIAAWHDNKAMEYKPYGDSTHRLDRVKAKEICEKVLAQKDSSEGRVNCFNLLQQINSQSLGFSTEKVNLPNQPFRAFIQYRNFSTLYLRVIKMNDSKTLEILNGGFGESHWAALIAAKPVRSWTEKIPNTKDHLEHGVEIRVEGLPTGSYLLLASTDKGFSLAKNSLGASPFYVSSISFISNEDDFFVLDRDNGQPLANAAVQVWEQRYDYNTSKYTREKAKLYRTDPNGFFRLERKKENNRYNYTYLLDITHNKDKLFMDNLITDYYYYTAENTTPPSLTSQHLFTDRSIYRPGQLVYFKGIVLSQNSKTNKADVLAGYETTLYLRDANYQDVDSLKVKTNEFGSYSGKFQLPETGLNGHFSLYTKKDNGNASFRMEEYKRPKFSVDYEAIKGTYKVNDTIKVTGLAKAYAGNNIDGAVVRYRVTRQPRFLYPWLFFRWWHPPTEPMEIAHGEARTDKDGKFAVEFLAIPDPGIQKKFEPVFDYIVHADVTDINGETRSAEKTVTVGYKALLLKVNMPSVLATDSLKTIAVRTENMNGEFEPATVNLTITRLREEKRLIRNRFWERPDQFNMSREDYIRNFPYDEYDNESDPKTWEKGEQVLEQTDSTRVNGQWAVNNRKWAPGFYIVEISTKDKNGEEVKDVRYVELYDEKTNQLSKPQYLWAEGAKTIEPGETTTVQLGTAADNLFVVQQQARKASAVKPGTSGYSFFRLNNEKKTIPFTATEADRGGYVVNFVFIKHNRVYQHNQVIEVPWTNKELNIEYASYRDKTLPGSEEKWKLKIKGYKNEKVAAEMLASMYDASLDQFYPHNWYRPSIWPLYYNARNWNGNHNFVKTDAQQVPGSYPEYKSLVKAYDYFIFSNNYRILQGGNTIRIRGLATDARTGLPGAAPVMAERSLNEAAIIGYGTQRKQDLTAESKAKEGDASAVSAPPGQPSGDIQIRKNFNETAFFFPDLRTDSEGTIEFSFTLPDALTRWKFQALAHTKELAFGLSSKEIVTQKQLMVQPNAPRFLREGDKMEFSAKIINLTEKEFTGQAELQLVDATSNQPIDGLFKNITPHQYFTVAAGQSEAVNFPLEVPHQFNNTLVWRIVAKAGDFSDGEENALPVLSNRMLVTETLPLPMKGSGTKNFNFEKLLQSGNSETLQHHALTVEYTSNPAWLAIQALPYLMEYPYDCAEQSWNRYYANSLGTFIANSSPRIKAVFDEWSKAVPEGGDLEGALLSNLQKNQELKSVLLEETPWVLQAKSEAEQKRNIALLFDMIRMSRELNASYEKLKQMQTVNGGFVWFKGGPDDRYITQYIVTGIGHLRKLNSVAEGQDTKLNQLLATAIPYLDRKIKEDYENLVKYKTDLKTYIPGYSEIQYLYMRSFFPDHKIPAATQPAYNYFKARIQQTWTKQNKYMQGMTALALHRSADDKTPMAILKSLKETALTSEELGMYWKDAGRSWWWYEAPIERQALLIEAFQEISKDSKTTGDLRTWLLKNKQANRWESTKATAEACYALLLQGTGPTAIKGLAGEPIVTINLGNTVIRSTDQKQEAGTGYFKKTIEGKKLTPGMGAISVTVASPETLAPGEDLNASWGSVYWQYFENLDKITTASTPLKLVKKLFVEKNTDRGPVLTAINDGDVLKVGDKIKVRIELRVDREMEYVHMKDMRASSLEPVNVLSSYKWQGGLGYYETTKDASTSFFFSNLRKGTYVFEYPLFVTHTGNFSNGITSIQCMYAPEFSSHSEGVRINVE